MSALVELLEALRLAEEHLDRARGQILHGQTALDQSVSAFATVDPEHPDTVVPPGLHRAEDQIERTLAQVDHVTDTLRSFRTRL